MEAGATMGAAVDGGGGKGGEETGAKLAAGTAGCAAAGFSQRLSPVVALNQKGLSCASRRRGAPPKGSSQAPGRTARPQTHRRKGCTQSKAAHLAAVRRPLVICGSSSSGLLGPPCAVWPPGSGVIEVVRCQQLRQLPARRPQLRVGGPWEATRVKPLGCVADDP